MRITNDAMDAVQWDGTNTEDIEAFAGARCVDATTVLVVPCDAADPREGLLGREPLHLPLGGWLVRANEELRVLPADALHALHQVEHPQADAPAVLVPAPEGTAA